MAFTTTIQIQNNSISPQSSLSPVVDKPVLPHSSWPLICFLFLYYYAFYNITQMESYIMYAFESGFFHLTECI